MGLKETIDLDRKNIHKTVHHVLINSYMVYFAFLALGVFLDIVFPLNFFREPWVSIFGFIFLLLATILIFWAQSSSIKIRQDSQITKESFCRGPYRFSRNPTHWGLFILILSFALIMDDFFIIIFNIIAFLITKVFFIKKEEAMLEQKYGVAYLEYKKTIGF